MAELYLQVIFAQEEKYGALITGQHWCSGPWGNTSHHLPALARWKISICWSNWPGWIVVFRVLDVGSWKAPEPVYNESHTPPSLLWHLGVIRPRQDAEERSCTGKTSRGALTIYRQPCWIQRDSGGLFACVCVYVCVLHIGLWVSGFAVCPCMLKCMRVYFYIILLLMYNTYI